MIAMFFSDQTVLSILFCVAQVTAFAAVGTIVNRWLIPRRPQMAATVACWVVADFQTE